MLLSLGSSYSKKMSRTMRPLHDRILVKVIPSSSKTAGGIVIPEIALDKPQEAQVIAVGNGKLMPDGSLRAVDVKVGDIILFVKHSGVKTRCDNAELLLLREEDVLAVIEERIDG